jgi:hypothetical protein
MAECDLPGDSAVARVSAAEVWRALTSNEEVLLVCAYREDDKFRNVPLVGAIARSRLDEWIPGLPTEQSLVFYCA